MKKAVKLIINGTVQGVFFRQFIKDSADNLNLKGFARNLDNGDVEVIAEGDHEEVEKMVNLCKRGPKFASIKNVSVSPINFSGDYKDFKIIRF